MTRRTDAQVIFDGAAIGVGQRTVDERRDERVERITVMHWQDAGLLIYRTTGAVRARCATSRFQPEPTASWQFRRRKTLPRRVTRPPGGIAPAVRRWPIAARAQVCRAAAAFRVSRPRWRGCRAAAHRPPDRRSRCRWRRYRGRGRAPGFGRCYGES